MRCQHDMQNNRLDQRFVYTATLLKTRPRAGLSPNIQRFCSMVYPDYDGHNIVYNSIILSSNCTLVITRCPFYVINPV